jgi:glutathione S-transferase
VNQLTLISHHLCPYVQRAVISLVEKSVPFERIYVDLANKPDWFKAVSPLGKTPVLKTDGRAIFESAVILEFLEETQPRPLHPTHPLTRAEHRAWIEFGSSVLNGISGFYAAPDQVAFVAEGKILEQRFGQLEQRLGEGPFFAGKHFSLVDAAFGPVFRYFDVFDRIGEFGVLADKPKVNAWRNVLAARMSIQNAVAKDYEQRLWAFLEARKSQLSRIMRRSAGLPLGRRHEARAGAGALDGSRSGVASSRS